MPEKFSEMKTAKESERERKKRGKTGLQNKILDINKL